MQAASPWQFGQPLAATQSLVLMQAENCAAQAAVVVPLVHAEHAPGSICEAAQSQGLSAGPALVPLELEVVLVDRVPEPLGWLGMPSSSGGRCGMLSALQLISTRIAELATRPATRRSRPLSRIVR